MLSIEKAASFGLEYDEYSRAIRSRVSHNIEASKEIATRMGYSKTTIDRIASTRFSLTGATKIAALTDLRGGRRFFELKSGRSMLRKGNLILRGPRYLAASDPRLSIPQKLNIFIEDFADAIDCVSQLQDISLDEQVITLAPILDYAKNSVVTLTNAFLQNEKRGNADLDDESYWSVRIEAIESGCAVTQAYYESLLCMSDVEATVKKLERAFSATEKLRNRLQNEYTDYALSSRDIVRPEASHPLVMLSFAAIVTEKHNNVDVVVGLPAGGTEIAYLVYSSVLRKYNGKCELLLLPISLHSMWAQYRTKSDPRVLLPEYLNRYKEDLNTKRILVVDDNSSSGATIHEVTSAIKDTWPDAMVSAAVAEADIVRTKLDLYDQDKRKYYAHPIVYNCATNILPVSRYIWRKHDLKEVEEAFSIASHYMAQAKQSNSIQRIHSEVFGEEARHPFNRRVAEPEWSTTNKIDRFQGTFLSNFHLVGISWRGSKYRSVEQAYQFSKFDPKTLRKLDGTIVRKMEAVIGKRIDNVIAIFQGDCSPKDAKRVANILRDSGLVKDGWDGLRVPVMIELLVAKFTHREIKPLLVETGDAYLVEGNDWGDTFWGACDENGRLRGRNVLGLIIMNIRRKIIEGAL